MMKNLLIWIVAIALSAVSSAAAIGAIAKSKAPELALSVFPVNGFAAETIAANLAKASVAENLGKFPDQLNSSTNALALQAFESEPIAPEAVAVMALSRSGDIRRDLMHKAFELSRRQQLVTGWMILDSGARDDIQAVLTYYDTTLRTNASAGEVVIPVMASALENENFVEPFAALLKQDPPWSARFWGRVAATPEAIGNAVELRRLLYQRSELSVVYKDAALINALVSNKQFEKAEQLYALISPSRDGGYVVRDGDFRHEPAYPPIDWQLFSTGEYGAVISQGSLQLSAIRNAGGLLARQLVKLSKSNFDLEVKFDKDVPPNANLSLHLSCAEELSGRPIRIIIPLAKKLNKQKISNQGSPCDYYWMSIHGRSADADEGFDIAVESISLNPE